MRSDDRSLASGLSTGIAGVGRRSVLAGIGAGAALSLLGCGESGSGTVAANAAPTGRGPARAETLASLPSGTFLENLAFGPDGRLYVTSYLDRSIMVFDPAASRGLQRFSRLDVHPVGIVFDGATAVITAHASNILEAGQGGMNSLQRIDTKGRATPLAQVPTGRFLNGLAQLAPGVFLTSDALTGTIWRIDAGSGRASPWLSDPRLAPVAGDPHPAANGVRVHDGRVYLSNYAAGPLMTTRLGADLRPGPLETLAGTAYIDDFAISRASVVFGATHTRDQVVRVAANGAMTVVADADDGVTGCTGAVFAPADERTLYVVTDGGFAAKKKGPARLVRLRVDPGRAA